jgi:predicted RNA binding protein YcfA (HicA-like mRNA interferase family)
VKPKSSREIIPDLLDDGWFEDDSTGSHRQFKHPTKHGKVTVPHPKKALKTKIQRSICQQAGLDPDKE